MENNTPRLAPIKDGAKILKVSRFALYRKIKAGEIPTYHFGRKVLIDIDEVLAIMRTGSSQGTP